MAMNISWKLWLCVVLLLKPYLRAADDDYIDGDPSLVPSAHLSASSVRSPSLTFLDLPTDVLGLVATTLNPTSFYALKSSCKGLRSFLSEEIVMREQLRLWGVVIGYECGVLTAESIVILGASSTLLTFWESKEYDEILKERSKIIKELRQSVLMTEDPIQKEIMLRQAIMLGGVEAATLWKDVLCLLPHDIALKYLVNTFVKSKEWRARSVIDEVLLRFIVATEEVGRALFDTEEGLSYLKLLCREGSFQAISLLAHKIGMGESGFVKDAILSQRLVGFLSLGTLESAWIMVQHKKNRKYGKITLQDVLPQIMSAIDARE